MKTLDMRQRNNLLTGNTLITEISSTGDLRSFVVVGAYLPGGGGGVSVSKFINAKEQSRYRFFIQKYEIGQEFIDNDWDMHEADMTNPYFKNGICSVDDLEHEIAQFVDDFAGFDNGWKSDSPIF